jgi:hypothetical protein
MQPARCRQPSDLIERCSDEVGGQAANEASWRQESIVMPVSVVMCVRAASLPAALEKLEPASISSRASLPTTNCEDGRSLNRTWWATDLASATSTCSASPTASSHSRSAQYKCTHARWCPCWIHTRSAYVSCAPRAPPPPPLPLPSAAASSASPSAAAACAACAHLTKLPRLSHTARPMETSTRHSRCALRVSMESGLQSCTFPTVCLVGSVCAAHREHQTCVSATSQGTESPLSLL